MSLEYRTLVSHIKVALKTKRMTYRDLARMLDVSEPTIKRLFTADDGGVSRLVEICKCLGVSFFEIAKLASEGQERQFFLSDDQEQHFCHYPIDYALFDELLKGTSPQDLARTHKLKQKTLDAILRRLEQNDVIERLPNSRVRLLFSGTHSWIHGGPMQKHFLAEKGARFLRHVAEKLGSDFPPDHFFASAERRVTSETLISFTRELREVFMRFRKRAQTEESLTPGEQLHAVKWVAALAPYESSFSAYLKD